MKSFLPSSDYSAFRSYYNGILIGISESKFQLFCMHSSMKILDIKKISENSFYGDISTKNDILIGFDRKIEIKNSKNDEVVNIIPEVG